MLVDPLTMKTYFLPPKSCLYVVKKLSYENMHSLMAAILNLSILKNHYSCTSGFPDHGNILFAKVKFLNNLRLMFWKRTRKLHNGGHFELSLLTKYPMMPEWHHSYSHSRHVGDSKTPIKHCLDDKARFGVWLPGFRTGSDSPAARGGNPKLSDSERFRLSLILLSAYSEHEDF